MTVDDQNAEVGRLASEYHSLHREVECLRSKCRTFRKLLAGAEKLLGDAERNTHRPDPNPYTKATWTVDHEMPMVDDINSLVTDLRSRQAELQDLKNRLERLGFPVR